MRRQARPGAARPRVALFSGRGLPPRRRQYKQGAPQHGGYDFGIIGRKEIARSKRVSDQQYIGHPQLCDNTEISQSQLSSSSPESLDSRRRFSRMRPPPRSPWSRKLSHSLSSSASRELRECDVGSVKQKRDSPRWSAAFRVLRWGLTWDAVWGCGGIVSHKLRLVNGMRIFRGGGALLFSAENAIILTIFTWMNCTLE